MIKCEPVTQYELKFEEGKPLPLYYLYTLVGQEYEVYRNEPELLRGRGEDVDYVLDVLRTVLNGFPKADTSYYDNDVRVFNVHFGDNGKSKFARVCFYVEGDILHCNVQRGHYGEDCSDTCTHVKYGPVFHMSWDIEDLIFYGFIDDMEDYDD